LCRGQSSLSWDFSRHMACHCFILLFPSAKWPILLRSAADTEVAEEEVLKRSGRRSNDPGFGSG